MRKSRLFKLLLGLLIITTSCFDAQGVYRYERFSDGERVVTKVPSKALLLSSEKNTESVSLSIYCDSVSPREYRVALFAYSSLNIFQTKLSIGFEDGTTDSFIQSFYNPKTGYAEFTIPVTTYAKMKIKKLEFVNFTGVAICANIRDKDYFINFLNAYYK